LSGGELVFPVLVPVGKLVEGKEWVCIGAMPSVIRLQRLNDFYIAGVHITELSVPAFERFLCIFGFGVETCVEGTLREDRELGSVRGGFPVPDDQLVGQMVKGGPPVVDDIPDNGTPLWRRFLSNLCTQDVLIITGVAFADDGIRIIVQESTKSVLENMGVVLNTP
jgi:hypothetical protein